MSSFVSANGPSVRVRFRPEYLIAPPLRARPQAGPVEQRSRLRELLVVRGHLGHELLFGHDAGFRLLGRLDHDHESHGALSCAGRLEPGPRVRGIEAPSDRRRRAPGSTSVRRRARLLRLTPMVGQDGSIREIDIGASASTPPSPLGTLGAGRRRAGRLPRDRTRDTNRRRSRHGQIQPRHPSQLRPGRWPRRAPRSSASRPCCGPRPARSRSDTSIRCPAPSRSTAGSWSTA